MAPILLDNRGLLKAGIVLLLGFALVFSGGFITGYQKAVRQQAELTRQHGMAIPAAEEIDEQVLAVQLASRQPAVTAPGELIDVDEPDANAEHDDKAVIADTDISGHIDVSPDQSPIPFSAITAESVINKTGKSAIKKTGGTDVEPAKADVRQSGMVQSAANKAHIMKSDTGKSDAHIAVKPVPKITQKSTLSKAEPDLPVPEVARAQARYSIQVGMYGRKENAEKLSESLTAQGLNAYVSEYMNKKQQPRYNVRFGYFKNKKSALKALQQYVNNQDGSGYLVRLKQPAETESTVSSTSSTSASSVMY